MFDFVKYRDPQALQQLDADFLAWLKTQDDTLQAELSRQREPEATFTQLQTSELVVAAARYLEAFLVEKCHLQNSIKSVANKDLTEGHVGLFKHEFVSKRARRYRGVETDFETVTRWLRKQISDAKLESDDLELAIATLGAMWLNDTKTHADKIEKLTSWCKLAKESKAGQSFVSDWSSFNLPAPIDHAHLVPLESIQNDPVGRLQANKKSLRQRDGFTLTDKRMSTREVQNEIHYCIFCHDHEGDFCSKGFPENKKRPELGLKANPLNVTLTGCPLEEKISEMHVLKRDGHPLAALAVAMIDNPMIPATGHRICNDCMKACIYQKKDPVNIPQIETHVLTDVLDLPYGVELYDLLTRWNPLRAKQYLMQPFNGRKVLISGMGPAGFTMAHHLSMEGCAVVGIDGLKIEPLPQALLDQAIEKYSDMQENLDERMLAGFGGVAEYGITVRWDKNFLKLIYLTLARRENFQAIGGVRLGGTVTLEDAWELGIDHVCIANGAGLPRVIPIGNSLARGMRQANDFLMALQLTGAAKDDSLANLQIRLPATVIGGGLTAVDTATEVQAYYIKQVEKILRRYETMSEKQGEEHITAKLDEENLAVLNEFLQHGRLVRQERDRARSVNEHPDFIKLLRDWGGVTIVYRKGLNQSPAYQRNHEEVIKAMEEGIYYAEGLDPLACDLDEYKHVKSLICRKLIKEEGRWLGTNQEVTIPARSVLVAAGTFPNTIYESEHSGTFDMEHDHFVPHVAHPQGIQPVGVAEHCKKPQAGPLTSYENALRRVSFIGDTHPVFNGSVVKAIASASRSYEELMQLIHQLPPAAKGVTDLKAFNKKIDQSLVARVTSVDDSHPLILEIKIAAPLAAKNFQAGQFFRLQTFESLSEKLMDTRLQITLQTISGAGVDGDQVRLMLLRYGVNAKLAQRLKPNDKLILMGPTGEPTPVHKDKTVMVIAGSWGAAVMLGLGPKLKQQNNRVLYFAAYGNQMELFCQDELEAFSNNIIWSVESGEKITSNRETDCSIVEPNVIQAIQQYAANELPLPANADNVSLKEVDEVLVMGGTRLLRALQEAFKGDLKHQFKSGVSISGTVGSPMQCMLKGVCSQCLQWQIDPETGERTRAVFSCAMQDQPLMWIDLDNLTARQGQNRLQEHINELWANHVLDESRISKIINEVRTIDL